MAKVFCGNICIVALVFNLFSLAVKADKSVVDSPNGWRRHFVLEPSGNKTFLLLIVDEPPEDSEYLDQLVLRKFYAKDNLDEAQKAILHFKSLPIPLSDSQKYGRIRTRAPIWNVTREWTAEDETSYKIWVRETLSEKYFVGSGIKLDCADTVLTIRWIYAREHNLPAALTMIGGKKLFGHWISTEKWDQLPTHIDWRKDQKFKAALSYAMSVSSSHSLLNDTFPITVNADLMSPGMIVLKLHEDSGHSETLQILDSDNSKTLWGNLPPQDKIYSWAFSPQYTQPQFGGYLRYRWPILKDNKWQLVPTYEMPGYSTEQYEWQGLEDTYQDFVFERIGLKPTTPIKKAVMIGLTLKSMLELRSHVTPLGHFYCSVTSCIDDPVLYDTYSTFARDARIQSSVEDFKKMASDVSEDHPEIVKLKEELDIPIFKSIESLTYSRLLFDQPSIVMDFVSDPVRNFFERWGLLNLSLEQKFSALAELWAKTWQYRDTLLNEAREKCESTDHDNGTNPDCNPGGKLYSQLSTVKLDHSLKKVFIEWSEMKKNVSATVLEKVKKLAKEQSFSSACCRWNWLSKCSAVDFLFSDKELVSNISSDPNTSICIRYGVR